MGSRAYHRAVRTPPLRSQRISYPALLCVSKFVYEIFQYIVITSQMQAIFGVGKLSAYFG